MKKHTLIIIFLLASQSIVIGLSQGQTPVGTDFTYQGQLMHGGAPGNGFFDFELELYDDPASGSQVGPTIQRLNVSVSDGLFDTELDFGSVFSGTALWLEIGVRVGGSGSGFTVLAPRQPVNPTPYSINSINSMNSNLLDGMDSSDYLLRSGGTIMGNLTVEGNLTIDNTITASALDLNGEVITSFETVTEPTVFFPAFVTCGNNAESDSAQWGGLASGTFRASLEGIDYDVVVSFVGVASMAEVAQRIQDALNLLTGGGETVAWDTDHFVLSSGDTTSASSVAPLGTHGSSTPIDISGAGASDWMDCDAGNGFVTKSELNTAFYDGFLARLDSGGKFDTRLMPQVLSGSAVNQTFAKSSGDAEGTYFFDIPIGFSGATHFRIFYHMLVRDFGGSSWLRARTGIIEGVPGGAILDIYGQSANTTSSTIAANTLIGWSESTASVSTSFAPLQVQSTTTLTVDSIETYEDNIRITLTVSNVSPNGWSATFKCKGILASR